MAVLSVLFTQACFADAEFQNNNEQIITAGIGLDACPIGCDQHQFASLFSEVQHTGGSVFAHNDGVEAAVRRGRIVAVFFFFNKNRTHQLDSGGAARYGANPNMKSDFHGRTDTGIGADSSIDDVIKNYGKPDRYWETLGRIEKGKEISLAYASKGISFTFFDGRLGDIRVSSPSKESPSLSGNELREKLLGEWQLNLYSMYQGLSFKEAFLQGLAGPVLNFHSDGTVLFTVPCDVNEVVNKKSIINGKWELEESGFISIYAKKEGDDLSVKGQLQFDDKSDEIDHLLIAQENGKNTYLGRFDRSLLKCD